MARAEEPAPISAAATEEPDRPAPPPDPCSVSPLRCAPPPRYVLANLPTASWPAVVEKVQPRVRPRLPANRNGPGMVLVANGVLTALVGVALIGYGYSLGASGCSAWPGESGCGGHARGLEIGGWVTLSVGLAATTTGGALMGALARSP
jgi:hypothetical protein